MLNTSQKSSSNFAQKCSLLSQYLKENGSFGNISLEMSAKLQSKGTETSRQQKQKATTTMNLLPILENSAEEFSGQNAGESTDDDHMIKSSTFGSASSQMTIFYAGKVLVFDDFPAEKAKEIMGLAGRFGSASALEKVDSGKAAFATPDLNIASTTSGTLSSNMNASQKVLLPHHHQPAKASLHRFFEKRKERITARAPYQVNHNTLSSSMATSAAAPEESSKTYMC